MTPPACPRLALISSYTPNAQSRLTRGGHHETAWGERAVRAARPRKTHHPGVIKINAGITLGLSHVCISATSHEVLGAGMVFPAFRDIHLDDTS